MINFKNKEFTIKGNSKYFKKKYGTANPIIRIEDTDRKVFGDSWMDMTGNPACLLFAMRLAQTDLPVNGEVFYGKIGYSGELVHEDELEEVKETV